MTVLYIDQININERRIFLRLDLNVPIDDNGKIEDDTRIKASLPTIKYAIDREARIIIASHLGRPKGERDPKYSLQPVAERLAELLETDIIFPEDCIGDAVGKLASELKPGKIMLLENVRFHKEETANNPNFSEKLAALCEVYINDAFGSAHRAHASTAGIANYVKEVGAGFLMKKEIECLTGLTNSPAKPFVTILGGAKVSDKIGVIENLIDKTNSILIGGGMAYTFLRAEGHTIGNSLFEADKVHTAKKVLERARTRGVRILLPIDHVVAEKCEVGSKAIYVDGPDIQGNLIGLDIGKKTAEIFSEKISEASTIFWNGPMGVCEISPFERGTFDIAKAVADSDAMSVVGGGDSIAAINKSGLAAEISHLCTGGGASLEFIEGKKLPGIVALDR